MKKYLHLTAIKKELTDEAQDKIDAWENMDDGGEPTCSSGNTREFYDNMGLKVPDSLIAAEKELNKPLDLDEETDYVYEYSDAIVDLKEFRFAVNLDENEDLGCDVWLKGNAKMTVAESAYDIYAQIDYLERSWFTKIKDKIKEKWNKLFHKK